MGFSETKCVSMSMMEGNYIDLQCETGHISNLVDWGISAKFEDQRLCKKTENNRCFDVLEKNNFNTEFDTLCKDKKNCTLQDFTYFIKGEGLG